MLGQHDSFVEGLIRFSFDRLWSVCPRWYLELLIDSGRSIRLVEGLVDGVSTNLTLSLWWIVLLLLVSAQHEATLCEHLHHHGLSVGELLLEMRVLVASGEIVQSGGQWHHRGIHGYLSLSLMGGGFVSNIGGCRLDHDVVCAARVSSWSRPMRGINIVDWNSLVVWLPARYHDIDSWGDKRLFIAFWTQKIGGLFDFQFLSPQSSFHFY